MTLVLLSGDVVHDGGRTAGIYESRIEWAKDQVQDKQNNWEWSLVLVNLNFYYSVIDLIHRYIPRPRRST